MQRRHLKERPLDESMNKYLHCLSVHESPGKKRKLLSNDYFAFDMSERNNIVAAFLHTGGTIETVLPKSCLVLHVSGLFSSSLPPESKISVNIFSFTSFWTYILKH